MDPVRKKHNLITRGLTSELFLLAFLEPDNIRKLAQRLQNTTCHPTNYGKASVAIHNLTISKYLKHKDGKFHPNILKIIENLEEILSSKNETLTDVDKLILGRVLRNNQFLKIISKDVVVSIQNQPKGKHSVNALGVLCERIGIMSATFLTMRNNNPEWMSTAETVNNMPYAEIEERFDEFEKFADKYSPILDKEMRPKFEKMNIPNKEFLMEFFFGFFKIFSSGMPMFMAPDSLLKKLSKLWDKYEGFLMADYVHKLEKK